MRILRIADVPDNQTGGMSRAMHSTGHVLATKGHQVDYLFREHLHVSGPDTLRRFTVPFKLPGLIRRMARQAAPYDVIEMHEPLGAPYCLARRTVRGLPPVVLYSHGLEERGRAAELAYKQGKRLPISLKNRYSPLTVVLQAMYAVRHCDHVIVCSSEDAQYLRRAGIPGGRITQLNTGVEPDFLAAGQALHKTDAIRSGLLFVSSWILRKGTLDLAPAVSRVLDDHPEAHFTVAGCGFDATTVLAAFPQHLHGRIRVIPKVTSNQALIDLYRSHAVFVLPSFFEGQPAVMIEAAALGLAIVTTNVCGMADFIADEVNGLLVPVGDVPALAGSLERLSCDGPLARRLGEAARQKAQSYSWRRSAEDLMTAYLSAASRLGRVINSTT